METELNLLFRQINSEDIDWILSHTKLSDPIHVSGLEGGWDNANILLKFSNGSKFVLKAWFANEIPEVERVVERHLHLQEHGIPTVVPVLLDNHGLLAKKDGFAWTLMPYIEGGFLGNDSESMESLGEVLARMHCIPKADCFPNEYRMGFSLFERVIFLCKEKGWSLNFLDILAKEASFLRDNLPSDLPNGVLHGDLFPDNIIGSEGSVNAILDLEEAWIGPLCFDIVMAFVGFCWEEGVPISSRWCSLIRGYQSVRSLSDEEFYAMPIMHRYATLAIACWRFWKHNLSIPNKELAGRYLEMVDRVGLEFDFSEGLE
ncbi:MAG: hypothetical protein CMB02_01395 [Euryarchaeota archaeon]|nr:hypothetical protein [Euryarchaeota archaeon]